MENDLGFVALFGAAGAVGQALAPALEQRAIAYRTVGRDVARLQRDFPHSQVLEADFFSGEGVADAAQGVQTVFYLAGAPYTEFYRHPVMIRNALDAARAAGVKRFVHVAPVYSYGLPRRGRFRRATPTRRTRARVAFDWNKSSPSSSAMATALRRWSFTYPIFTDLTRTSATRTSSCAKRSRARPRLSLDRCARNESSFTYPTLPIRCFALPRSTTPTAAVGISVAVA